jgi:anti-sigma B factor antagonist
LFRGGWHFGFIILLQFCSRSRWTTMPLSLVPHSSGDITVLHCSGRIVAGPEIDVLRKHINSLLPGCRYILLDLEKITFIDSMGMGELVHMLTTARRCGGDLKLCNISASTVRVLRVTNLHKVFEITETEEHGLNSFRSSKIGHA